MKISITAHDCARIYLSGSDLRRLGLTDTQGEPTAEMRLLVSGIAAFLSQLGLFELGSGEIDCTVSEVFDRVVDPMLLVRRLNITVNNVVSESQMAFNMASQQLDLFTDYDALRRRNEEEAATRNRERRMQQALLGIKKKFGKNAILRGLNFEDGATARERNQQIGGHKA